ncbi:mirror-image polydactyly gene 1 protein [Gadus macrocephalus]|uniref:mirror-image polydactyly gene 1 protein n=1 Tax=Gadus macrocephalus TaxID=80720 RepID=UPI0028CB62BC|nr:mirror-image polydactyly gene 1 protein [Gadus macrocephalus]
MAHCSRSLDVRFALERAKKKICGLEHKLSALVTVSDGEESEVGALPWTQSKELKESLVDMYKANPNVNQELRRWLSPTHGCSGVTHSLPPGLTGHTGAVLPKPQDTFQGAVCLQRSSSSPAPAPVPGIMEASPSPAPFTQTDTTGHAPSPQADAPLASPDTRSRGLSREKNVSFLLKELDSLRAVNSKLQLQLVHQQKEVEEHQLGEEFRTSPQLLPQAVFQELCAAQRERDQALMSRLRLANEERDEALLRAKRLQQQEEDIDSWLLQEGKQMEDTTPAFNMTVSPGPGREEVLGGLAEADSARSVQQTGAVLLALLQKARQRHRDITTQEMTVLIDERDRTATKLNRLELLTREKNQAAHDACKEELERAERERDRALEQQQQLEGEITRLQGESRRALSHGVSPAPGPRDGGEVLGSTAGQEAALTLSSHPSRQQQDLDQRLQASLQAEGEACAKIQKLERLVEVLRKKVGTGSLRSVV